MRIGYTVRHKDDISKSPQLFIVAFMHDAGTIPKCTVIIKDREYEPPVSYRESDLIVVSEEWPNNNIEFNKWYLDLPLFLQILEMSEFSWVVRGSRFKYLNYTVDNRGGRFVVQDRDGVPVTDILDILNNPTYPKESDGKDDKA